MMQSCKKCLKNNWAFKVVNGIVFATCDNCGNRVEFKAKDKTIQQDSKTKKALQEGDKCCRRDKECLGLLYWKEDNKITKKRLEKAYHYEKWLKCDKCGAVFFDNKYKVLHETGPDGSIRFR